MWACVLAWNGREGVLTSVGLDYYIAPLTLTSLAETKEEYFRVLTPLNHFLWALATLANEVAASYDGVLISLKLYRFTTALYASDLLLVLLPLLALSRDYSSITLALLAWSLVRLLGILWAIYRLEVPKYVARLHELEAGCSREVILKWLRVRCDLPEEKFQAEKAQLDARPPGPEREMFRRRESGPWASYARENGTSVVAMEAMGQRLYLEGDKELQDLVHRMIFRWGDKE